MRTYQTLCWNTKQRIDIDATDRLSGVNERSPNVLIQNKNPTLARLESRRKHYNRHGGTQFRMDQEEPSFTLARGYNVGNIWSHSGWKGSWYEPVNMSRIHIHCHTNQQSSPPVLVSWVICWLPLSLLWDMLCVWRVYSSWPRHSNARCKKPRYKRIAPVPTNPETHNFCQDQIGNHWWQTQARRMWNCWSPAECSDTSQEEQIFDT